MASVANRLVPASNLLVAARYGVVSLPTAAQADSPRTNVTCSWGGTRVSPADHSRHKEWRHGRREIRSFTVTSMPRSELLTLIRSLAPDDRHVDTETLARAVFDADRAGGRSALLYPKDGPWYGLSSELRELEDLGLIDVDPGIAEFVPPGGPAPIARHFFVGLTDEGVKAIAH